VNGRILLSLALAASAAGCAEDFDPYNRLTSLRVLAVQSEPASPGPGETTTLTPLVFTPEPGAAVTYAWSWCPFPGPARDGYPCLVTQEQATMLAGQTGVTIPPFDLGAGPTAQLPHGFDPNVLRALCAGQPGTPQQVDCEGGFPVQVKVTVASAGDTVVTVRTLRLRIDSPPNANPRIDGLAAVVEGADRPITDEPAVTITRAAKTTVKAMLPETLSETYPGKDDNGQPAEVRERLFLSWFIESGDTDDEVTGYIPGKTELQVLLENEWLPGKLKDYPKDTARLVVVVRDNRGGVGWKGGVVRLAGDR
jgi:hypothetical protein